MLIPFTEFFQKTLTDEYEGLARRRFTPSFRERLEDRYQRALDYLHERRCREAKRNHEPALPIYPCARCGKRIVAAHICSPCWRTECHSSLRPVPPHRPPAPPPEADEEPAFELDAEPRECLGCGRTVDGFASYCHFCAGDAKPWTVDGWLEAARKATNPDHFYLEDHGWFRDVKAVAIHEASHAVVAAVLGLSVNALSITKCECGCGCWEGITHVAPPRGWDGDRGTAREHKPYFARQLIVKAAGHAGEQKLQGKKLDLNETGSGQDYEASVEIVKALGMEGCTVLGPCFAAATRILDMPEAWELVEKLAAAVQVTPDNALGLDRMLVLLDRDDARLATCRSRLNGLLPPVVGGPS